MATLVVISLYRFRFFASATQYKVGKAFLKTLTNLFRISASCAPASVRPSASASFGYFLLGKGSGD